MPFEIAPQETLTKQEFFDRTARHLREQGGPSAFVSAHGGVRCLYRGQGGTRCAVGLHIKDHEYNPLMEDIGASAVIRTMLPDSHPLQVHISLASALQGAHDTAAKRWSFTKTPWRMALDDALFKVASCYDLTFTA